MHLCLRWDCTGNDSLLRVKPPFTFLLNERHASEELEGNETDVNSQARKFNFDGITEQWFGKTDRFRVAAWSNPELLPIYPSVRSSDALLCLSVKKIVPATRCLADNWI